MRKETALLFFLLLLKFTLPFLLSHSAYELHRDEHLSYQQGQHPDFGYFENPPLIGVLALLSSLSGGTFFWLKFWPSVFGAATLWVTMQMVKELGGRWFAQMIAAFGILFTVYLRIHFFSTQLPGDFLLDSKRLLPERFINTDENRFLFFLPVSLSFGWYSKYSVLFFIAALLVVSC